MHPYSEMYLSDAMKNLGEAFDYAVHDCNIEIDEFMNLFISSGYAHLFGDGHPKYVSGLSGTELVMTILEKQKGYTDFPEPKPIYDYSAEYWCGWALAYYQWKTNKTFESIHTNISMKEILKLYHPLHEASEDKFVDTVNGIIKNK